MDLSQPDPKMYNVPWIAQDFHGMPYRQLGKTGLCVSAVGIGTWKYGLPATGDGSRVDEKTAFSIFDRAVALGVTFWDTANRYNFGSGNSERVIGRWLAANPAERRNVVIATKLFGGMDGITPNHSRLSRTNILESLYASLERLNVDYVDLLYFHAYDDTSPVEESLTALEDLVRQDVVRYFAVSNFTVEQLKQYQLLENSLSIRCRVAAVQNQFDILDGEDPDTQGVLEFAAGNGVSFIAYSPLARGLLTSRYLDASRVGPGDRLFDEKTLKDDLSPAKAARLSALNAVAVELNVELSTLVLAYMLTIPGMGPVIPAASTVDQLEANSKAGALQLSQDTLQRIRVILT